jgi:hypothetical protein
MTTIIGWGIIGGIGICVVVFLMVCINKAGFLWMGGSQKIQLRRLCGILALGVSVTLLLISISGLPDTLPLISTIMYSLISVAILTNIIYCLLSNKKQYSVHKWFYNLLVDFSNWLDNHLDSRLDSMIVDLDTEEESLGLEEKTLPSEEEKPDSRGGTELNKESV